jgi:predicted acylesterase/phospholipase RssA
LLYGSFIYPLNTQDWLKTADFYLHHHIRNNTTHDFQRLLRFMRGKATGVVLSGGGVKGWAHIGAIKAILDAKIPIDAIAGTSIGSIIAALYAMNESYHDMASLFEDLITATKGTVSLLNLCWPSASLFSCEKFTLELKKIYSNLKIENLRLPYFCITTNLNQYSEAVHRQGILWEKIRGSVSIPGLVPPMVINGELHFDGGLVNNLPINRMQEMLGPEGKIIGIELVSHNLQNQNFNFPPTLTPRETFLSKLRLGYRDYHFPSFLDTFLKSLLVGSSVKQKENSAHADLLIQPNTAAYSMTSLKHNGQKSLMDLGYAVASAKISAWDRKKKC